MRHLGRWMTLFVCVVAAGQAFSTCPPGATGLTPGQGDTNISHNVILTWDAVPGATHYDIFLGTAGACSGEPVASSNTTQFQPPPLDGSTTYEWKVRAMGIGPCGVTPPESSCVSFTTAACPTASTNTSPAANAVVPFGNVTFTWAPVANATTYELFAGLDGDNPSPLGFTNTTSKSLFIEPGRTVEWFVKTHADGCDGEESDPTTFTTTCQTNPATLLAPPRNASFADHQTINFNWSNVPGAAGYDVNVSSDGGESFEIIAENLINNSFSTNEFGSGAYQWQVRANFDGDCDPLYAEPREFTVALDCSGSTAVELQEPANNAVATGLVTFRWTARANAEAYQLYVHRTGSNVQRKLTETNDNEYTTDELEAGTFEWKVVTLYDGCPDVASAGRILTIEAEPEPECDENANIALLTPADGASTTSPVRLSWTAVAEATFYRVWISTDGGAPVNIERTNGTEATLRLPSGAMTWYVDAQREHCDAVVSDEGHFTVARAASCESNAVPQLIAPLGTRANPASANNPVTLVWNAVANAIGYRVWISHDLLSFEDIALTGATRLELDDLDPGVHAWYVQALFEGCSPTASAESFFRVGETEPRCPTGKPSIVSPSDGSQSTSPVTFRWTAVEGAIKYRVFASIDESEIKLLGSTDDTELTRTLPPGRVVWAVEAVFDECPSTISNRVAFTIPRGQNCNNAPAQLASPGNGATNVASPVDFAWSPVSRAVKYVLFAQANDGSPTAIASTSDTHFTHAMPAGVIRWWVITFFSGCDPVESAHNFFTVSRNAACDNRRPILLLPEDRTQSPVRFQWTAVPRADGYRVWARQDEANASVIASTVEPFASVELPEGTYEYYVEATFEGCPSTESARAEFAVTPPVPCGTPRRPEAQVIGQALSETRYRVRWTPLPNVKFYEVQESTSFDFSTAPTLTTSENSLPFSHAVTGAPVQYLYRVRGVSDCGDARGPYSEVVGVFIIAPKTNNASTEIGSSDPVIQKVFLPGSTSVLQFTATTDKPWLSVAPTSGALPLEGTTLTVTADPAFLALGTNTGTIQVQYSGSSGKGPQTNASIISTVPLSVSLVTPVLPTGKGTPPPDSLIFPVVGHATGINDSLFESDIRVTNLTAQTMKYALNFTPSGVDGTQTGSSSTIEIAPNATMALDDIVASLFGIGTTSSATGMLEVRPLTTSSSPTTGFFGSTGAASTVRALATAASSRTYNFTPSGTFGQFIPAVRFSDFVGKAAPGLASTILSLQQVAQSSAFRANFGFAEGSGSSADLAVRVYDIGNNLLQTIAVSLQPGEHKQINGMLASNGITSLADGRVEVEVIGGNGKVTAYVSEVDNITNDPLLVTAVPKGGVTANKYVVPGVAYLNNPQAFWVTDLRVFNAGAQTQATLTFYPQNNPAAAIAKEITLLPGEIEVLDNVLGTLFEQAGNAGGSVAVTTPANSQLTATARTYNKTSTGTYGQYIAGVTPAESVGASDRALQLLQLEQSSRFRTNIGLTETNGQSARVEVTAIVPDLIVSPVVAFDLQPNEFRQFSLGEFGIGNAVYNARVTVKVISGNGRVTTYGSVIDAITQDPTYVPAQ
jgi:hypothetical protein